MKIVIDDKIPYIKGVFEPFAEVRYLPGAAITPEDVKNADALITRTRTQCDKNLLEGSSVKFIATATIGYDHIDTEWCRKANIQWTNAPGCNSSSVEQYVIAAILHLAQKRNIILKGKTIGVIGVGNVGTKVARVSKLLGMNVLLNDPPRERKEQSDQFVSLEQIKEEANIISLHVPLQRVGPDKTYHLIDRKFLAELKNKPLLLNTCRGEVTETTALQEAITQGEISGAVIDCWEHEPTPDPVLLKLADITTPHIAGYSRDGKANGTTQCVQSISQFFHLGLDKWKAVIPEHPTNPLIVTDRNGTIQQQITQAVLATYPIWKDSDRLTLSPESFEKQRGDYPVRREYQAYTIKEASLEAQKILSAMKFNLSLIL